MRGFALFMLVLAGCDRNPEVPTPAEDRDLDEASRMLDEARNELPAPTDNMVAPPAEADPKM